MVIFPGIAINVEEGRITGRVGTISPDTKLRRVSGRRDKLPWIDPPITPAYGHDFLSGEGNETFPIGSLFLAEEKVSLVDAIDRSIGWQVGSNDLRQSRECRAEH